MQLDWDGQMNISYFYIYAQICNLSLYELRPSFFHSEFALSSFGPSFSLGLQLARGSGISSLQLASGSGISFMLLLGCFEDI